MAIELGGVPKLFKALGDSTRLRIVALLSHGELCVCHLQQGLGLAQPAVSRQLAILRSAGIVEDRREGSWVYYRLAVQQDPDCARHLAALIETHGHAKLQREVKRLVRSCGPDACG